MISTLLMLLFSIFFDLLAIVGVARSDKDLELVRDLLFQFPDENRTEMVQYEGEISWEASSRISKDSLLLRFL